jgi:signal peptidase II
MGHVTPTDGDASSPDAAASRTEAPKAVEPAAAVEPVDSPESGADRRAAAPAGSRRPLAIFLAVAATALALDVVSKVLVAAKLARQMTGDQQPVRVLFGAIYLDETRNSGAAFSVGTGATVVLTIVAVAVIAIILRTASRMRSAGWAVSLGLVLGGALGNLIDRLFRAPGVGRGHVVDWISLFGPNGAHWPIFNLADSAIVSGAVLAAILALRGIDLDGRGTQPE